MVFNIAEGLSGFGREAQVPALLEAYQIPYTFSDPLVLSLTLHKAMAKHVIRDMGVPTPDFVVVEKESDTQRVDLAFPLFAKPVAEGTGKGINPSSKIKSKSELRSVCAELLRTYKQPVLVETFLPGREFTVGILGTGEDARSIGVMEVFLKADAEAEVYSYLNKEKCEDLVEYRIVDDAAAEQAASVALDAWKGLGCRDAGRIDLRVDGDGTPKLMELNPLAGLHPEHSDLCIIASKVGLSYPSLIGEIMASARKRNSQKKIADM
jgi:D-alanine-D-alanine ligase